MITSLSRLSIIPLSICFNCYLNFYIVDIRIMLPFTPSILYYFMWFIPDYVIVQRKLLKICQQYGIILLGCVQYDYFWLTLKSAGFNIILFMWWIIVPQLSIIILGKSINCFTKSPFK